ncbi:hypothetical protein GJAV_G00136420 [Gymnothorax javanicus]|nr:hypothetical protein GJAV_G00136420 [Gymnothorax javanicus]
MINLGLITGHSRISSGSAMDEKSGSPAAVRTEKQSQSVLFTYFQGDINSVVDEHFSRALNKANKPKDLSTKSKSSRRSPKSAALASAPASALTPGPSPGQWVFPTPAWSESDFPSSSSGRIQLSAADDLHSPQGVITSASSQPSALWPFAPRSGASFGIPGMVYPQPLSTEGPGGSEHQDTSSFLNLLHSDRPVGGATVSFTSKPELAQAWSPSTGFREPLGPGISLDAMPEKKKDLYWY